MPSKVDFAALETLLVNPSLKATDLRAILKNLAPLKQLKPVRGFPVGTPWPEFLRTRFELDPAPAATLSAGLMRNTDPGIRGWRVFPIGIINPERYIVEVDVGRPR